MISVGKHLCNNEPLQKVTLDYLFHSLRHPKPEIASKIRQLRIVKDIDPKQYKLLKRQLPFVVCGMFNPPYRKIENFAYTEYFIVDIDHISEKGIDMEALITRLHKDPRIILLFKSPSEDGVKLFFRLKERCYDAMLYSLFYREFAKQFSMQYGLEQVVDNSTSDVSRACFISIDANAYNNPQAEAVDINSYLSPDDSSSLFRLKKEIEQSDKIEAQNNKSLSSTREIDPDEQTIKHIKSILNPNLLQKNKTAPFVPQELDDIIQGLRDYITHTGMEVQEIINIQYAKKIRCRVGKKQAEVNLFYGKRGFNVVQSPRCGTSAELNQLLHDLTYSYLQTL